MHSDGDVESLVKFHSPSARLALNRSGKDDFKFSLAANSAINFMKMENLFNHPAIEVVNEWNFRAVMPLQLWLKKN